jgi:PAS domain S-box-containing protein
VIGLVIIGAVLSARPDQPPLVELDQRYDRGLLRWMLPLLVLVPFLPAAIGWVVAPLVDDPAARAAITQLITVVILVTVIVLMGSGTSRARREVALQRQRLWEAFEHAPAATAVVSVDGRITTANHALARLTHRPSDALVGTFAYDLVADQDHATVALALAEVAAGRSGFRRDVRFRGPSTISTWVDLSIAPVRHSNGEVTYLILQCTDLSDRRQLERALQDPQVTSGRPVPAPDEPGSPQPRYPSRSGR